MVSPGDAGNSKDYGERRLARAVEHVSKHWLPYNPTVLTAVKTGVSEGRYELGAEFLLGDLKQDLGLFSFCLREVIQAKKGKDPSARLGSPEQCFEGISSREILDLLQKAEKVLSSHTLAQSKDSQAAQLRFTLISAATAEVLANRTELDSEAAFLSSLFRQLGRLLVAWNYPTVFERVQRASTQGADIDAELTSQLGFSPEMLGHSILQSYSPSSELESVVVSDSADPSTFVLSKTSQQLAEICRAGEVLAQANDPEHYPAPSGSWDQAKSLILQSLGPEAFTVIREAVKHYGESYQKECPEIFSGIVNVDPERHQEGAQREKSLRTNPFVERCPLHIRQRFIEFYKALPSDPSPRASVSRVLKEIIPVTGFEGGMIATIEPARLELIPRLKFGEMTLRKAVPQRFGDRLRSNDPLIAALTVPSPYVSRAEGVERAFAVGGLGGEQPIGVLYAECPTELLDIKDYELLVVFRAVLRAFEDALRLA